MSLSEIRLVPHNVLVFVAVGAAWPAVNVCRVRLLQALLQQGRVLRPPIELREAAEGVVRLLEQVVDLLESQVLCFGEEEEGEYQGGYRDAAKDPANSEVEGLHHVGDGEVGREREHDIDGGADRRRLLAERVVRQFGAEKIWYRGTAELNVSSETGFRIA